jgi:hypothetical protein
MTYARSRLWLGITGVGTAVVLAAATVATAWPSRLLPASDAIALPVHLAHLAAVFAALVLLFFPLDLLGGAIVVRPRRAVGAWLARWLRGALVFLLLSMLTAAALMAAARAGGNGAAWLTSIAIGVAVVATNARLARLAAPVRVLGGPLPEPVRKAALRAGVDAARVRLVEADDEAFTGGWTGLTAGELWVPARWATLLEPDELAAQLARRASVRSGRWRGILLALAWNAFGWAAALDAPGGGAATAAGLVTSAAWFTIWQFAGVLLLPSLSRSAVYTADAIAATRVGADPTYRAISKLDELQESEPIRGEVVEAIFHPVPQVRERVLRLKDLSAADPVVPGFYHATRLMLGTGLAQLGWLGRVVHCNVGRPELWVFYPSD